MFFVLSDFFFCKQKTSYEMRIRDWSSDVCSSDLADLLALVEARPADHAVGNAEGDEAFLELAGLKACPHQHRDFVQAVPGALQRLDFLADDARLLLAVPQAADHNRLAGRRVVGVERLDEPPFVMSSEERRVENECVITCRFRWSTYH